MLYNRATTLRLSKAFGLEVLHFLKTNYRQFTGTTKMQITGNYRYATSLCQQNIGIYMASIKKRIHFNWPFAGNIGLFTSDYRRLWKKIPV